MEQTSAAEQRAFAVAKLKRAASLPRMKDGRRPPMHVEGVSEGEKGAQTDDKRDNDSTPPSEAKEEAVAEESRVMSPEPVTRTKRRSRSRSRLRGSKDLKGKARATQSPIPSSVAHANDSSPDESPTPPPANVPFAPPLLSPIPSHFTELQASRLLMSTLLSPETPLLYPGTSPPTPILPSLEAIQRGIHRSNSAAARMIAMRKLTGGTEPYDHTFSSPSPTPPPMSPKLGRNNTVSGGERSAARTNMLGLLRGRIKEADGDQTSGGEEIATPSPPPKRRRRRSRRGSSNAPVVVDESDMPSTSTNTPIVPPTPLPPTPLPPPFDIAGELLRAPSVTPSQGTPARDSSTERNREGALAKLTGDSQFNFEPPTRKRRSVVVEEDDAPDETPPPQPSIPDLPRTPHRVPGHPAGSRVPHSSDAPSHTSTDSGPASAIGVPIFLSATQKTPSKHERFPSSPFTTPLKEKPFRDEDEEEVVYGADSHLSRRQSPYHDAYDREISWIADPIPESRIPIYDDQDEDEPNEDEPHDEVPDDVHLESADSSQSFSPQVYEDLSPRESSFSKEVVVEVETSPEVTPAYMPPSPSSTAALFKTTSTARASDDSSSPKSYPARLSVASPTDYDWDDSRAVVNEGSSKRNGDGPASAWEKVKNTFSRSGSSSGRRSRTNSIATRDRRDNTDSSISRESGASLTSGKTDKNDNSGVFSQQQAQSLMQTPSASASIISLAPQTVPRGGVSPIPPASMADLQKYKDSKLFPFPGMKKLEEQRNRSRGMSLSASSPDIVLASNGTDNDHPTVHSSSSGNTPAQSPQMGRDRKLSHQASDTRLLAKYNNLSPPPMAAALSSSSHTDYFNIGPMQPPTSTGPLSLKLPLPTNREGVKKWLSTNRLFSPKTTSPSSASLSPPAGDIRSPNANKKPSLSDLLKIRKESELIADWEEISSDKSRTPTSASGGTFPAKQAVIGEKQEPLPRQMTPSNKNAALSDVEKTPKAKRLATNEPTSSVSQDYPLSDSTPPFPSPSDQPSSPTPDPVSSLDDYPARSTSESSSTSSSHYSNFRGSDVPSQGAIVLERLDEMIGRGSRSPMWASAIEDPPRKLVLSSPVLQVVNSNTVKDRFLFLFTDILVIAKPIIQDSDTLLDKPNPADRKFIVKSVVLLNRLRFSDDREDSQSKISSYLTVPRHPLLRTFIHQFAKDPDHAISSLFAKAGSRDDPVALGQLLFETLELDRARLGDYLSRRTSKVVLKAYLDGFGFTGLRVDIALRAFLRSINVPTRSSQGFPFLEVLLDAFAGRWYEANTGIVAYDKDLAVRLVRAVVQLNDVLHGTISQEPGPTGYVKRNVTSRDFSEAFRRIDPRCLVTDELLEDVHKSITEERLCQARKPGPSSPPDLLIAIKRTLPSRLTYRIQSDPIILRIPQFDPDLNIQLYGQDLIFDPPVLNFAKSPEASFRVTGTSLGVKTMTMLRSGANALMYTGLPLSNTLVIERAFMRNTFQVAFTNPNRLKRRYMFSVDDPLVRHQWVVSFKRQINSVAASTLNPSSPTSSKFHRAVEEMALKVLQDKLIGMDESSPPTSAESERARSPAGNGDSPRFSLAGPKNGSRPDGGLSMHARSKSRSEVYHRHGLGKLELDLVHSRNNSHESNDDGPLRSEGRLWSGRSLELECQQNSSIPQVLSFLQVGAPDYDHQHIS